MLSFCGQDKIVIDANGRLKFSPRVISDFENSGGLEVVLHCLPERAIAVYPEAVYLQMRKNEAHPAERAAESMVFRRTMRRFGALSSSEQISQQGRITLPPTYRELAELLPGTETVVVGCEIGVEIWNYKLWMEELNMINKHLREKGDQEMSSDLAGQSGQF